MPARLFRVSFAWEFSDGTEVLSFCPNRTMNGRSRNPVLRKPNLTNANLFCGNKDGEGCSRAGVWRDDSSSRDARHMERDRLAERRADGAYRGNAGDRTLNSHRESATRLAENGVSESTMLALMGHLSRSRRERYSHIRMAAKREAVAGVKLRQKDENSSTVPVEVPVVEQSTRVQ